MKIVSAVPDNVLSVLADAISASFSKAVFPSCLKRAQVIPLYKSGDRSCPANYRPIALLPTLSKVLEKLVQRRMMSFLERHELLSPSQFGFRPAMGTNDAIFFFSSGSVWSHELRRYFGRGILRLVEGVRLRGPPDLALEA